MKQTTKSIWIANDGTEFLRKKECQEHELYYEVSQFVESFFFYDMPASTITTEIIKGMPMLCKIVKDL